MSHEFGRGRSPSPLHPFGLTFPDNNVDDQDGPEDWDNDENSGFREEEEQGLLLEDEEMADLAGYEEPQRDELDTDVPPSPYDCEVGIWDDWYEISAHIEEQRGQRGRIFSGRTFRIQGSSVAEATDVLIKGLLSAEGSDTKPLSHKWDTPEFSSNGLPACVPRLCDMMSYPLFSVQA